MANKIIRVGEKVTKRGKTFSDLGLYKNKPIGKATDIFAIKNALNNIFKFKTGERILDPEFGNGLYKTLFEPMSSELHKRQLLMVRKMMAYEPRVNIESLNIVPDAMNQQIHIVIAYSVPKLGIADVFQQTISV